MEQINYKLEIVRFLLKKKGHAREIAKKLNTNHMMIVRKIKELSEENIVDFTQEGKNKVYFLKKTIEAQAYAFMSEHYALIQTIKKYPGLRNIISAIQRNKRIRLAVLFGSYAKGMARKDSDIDIFIDTKDRDLKKEISFLDSKTSIKIGIYDKKSNLIKEIDKSHVILKGIRAYYEKSEFFD